MQAHYGCNTLIASGRLADDWANRWRDVAFWALGRTAKASVGKGTYETKQNYPHKVHLH
jgi:hypothetical protein